MVHVYDFAPASPPPSVLISSQARWLLKLRFTLGVWISTTEILPPIYNQDLFSVHGKLSQDFVLSQIHQGELQWYALYVYSEIYNNINEILKRKIESHCAFYISSFSQILSENVITFARLTSGVNNNSEAFRMWPCSGAVGLLALLLWGSWVQFIFCCKTLSQLLSSLFQTCKSVPYRRTGGKSIHWLTWISNYNSSHKTEFLIVRAFFDIIGRGVVIHINMLRWWSRFNWRIISYKSNT